MDHSNYCTVWTMTHRKKIRNREEKNPFILSNCITNSTQHVNYSEHTGQMHKCPGVKYRNTP